MSDSAINLFSPMSPAAFAPLDGVPGVLALARDAQFRVVWCNAEYARMNGKSVREMLGSTLHDIMPKKLPTNEPRSCGKPSKRAAWPPTSRCGPARVG